MTNERKLVKCGQCKGSGEVPYNRYNNEYTICPVCQGTGQVPALMPDGET